MFQILRKQVYLLPAAFGIVNNVILGAEGVGDNASDIYDLRLERRRGEQCLLIIVGKRRIR